MVPDLCTVNVDIRLTPALDASAAAALLHTAAADTDAAWPGTPPTGMDITTRWPPYALPDGSPLRDALLQGAARAGLAPVAKIAGPSNIGNYLAGLGIPATAGIRRGLPGPARHRRTHPPGLHTTHPSRLPLRAPHPSAQHLTCPSRKATATREKHPTALYPSSHAHA
jgi:acetylornithine deacetylase/succinyl-diaminopimelate desuccinylase-like protein